MQFTPPDLILQISTNLRGFSPRMTIPIKIKLVDYIRQHVVERTPGETEEGINELMDPNSRIRTQVFMSYMAFLLSNGLLGPKEIESFVLVLNELGADQAIENLMKMNTPTANALITKVLHAAIRLGLFYLVKSSIRKGVDVECRQTGWRPMTLLQQAIESGDTEIVQLLLEAGADPNGGTVYDYGHHTTTCDKTRYSSGSCHGVEGSYCRRFYNLMPLTIATCSKHADALIPLLLERGATIPSDPLVLEAISHGASLSTVWVLLEAGASANDCVPREAYEELEVDATPLSLACERGDVAMAMLLLEFGANPDGPLKSLYSQIIADYGKFILHFQFRTGVACS